MTDQIYIRPVGFVPGPQHEEGKVIRLAGGMVYAQRFAVVLRQDGKFTRRWVCDTDTIGEVLAGLPASVSDEAQAQLTNLTLKHPPLNLGARVIRLDQPQVMGILNVTPDSFSDGERSKVFFACFINWWWHWWSDVDSLSLTRLN